MESDPWGSCTAVSGTGSTVAGAATGAVRSCSCSFCSGILFIVMFEGSLTGFANENNYSVRKKKYFSQKIKKNIRKKSKILILKKK